MQVAENGKCNNMHRYQSIWEERIKCLTHIFLSSQVNIEWMRLKTQQWTNEYVIELNLINSLNSSCWIHFPFSLSLALFYLKLQNNVQSVFCFTKHFRHCTSTVSWSPDCQICHNTIPQENSEQNLFDEENFIDTTIAWFRPLIAVFVSVVVLSKMKWSAVVYQEMEFCARHKIRILCIRHGKGI
jgi:hypothetical protein